MRAATAFAACVAALLVTGCARKASESAARPLTARERQDRALHDPFGYKPDFSDTTVGGDTGAFDKQGLRKDIDNVLLR